MEYVVIKQKRKSASISIDDNDRVIIKVPQYMKERSVKQLVRQHEAWIIETLGKKRQLRETKDWLYTGNLLYFGTLWPIRVEIVEDSKAELIFNEQDGFVLRASDDEFIKRSLIENFFRKQAKSYLTMLTDDYAKLVGVSYNRLTIRKQATRWGSCSSKGNLSYNLKILCAPKEMIAYVVLHEVMHLRHFNHSKAFWQDIETVMPDYKVRMNYFKEFGQNFMI